MTPLASTPAPSAPAKAPRAIPAVAAICLVLYGIDLACLATVPGNGRAFTADVAVPFDLMVCVPLAFYFLFVRPRKLSPAFVLPVIYLGALVSSQLAGSLETSLLSVLLPATLVVDAAILGHEGLRLARAFRAARAASSRPFEWFRLPLLELSRNERAARMGALELSVWYYVVGSWRARADVPQGCQAFSYHRDNGYVALSGVIMALLPFEAAVVHVLVAQWSTPAAWVLTALTVYTLVWFAGNTRAVVLNPILVDDEAVTVRWGAYFSERIPFGSIERITTTDPDLSKSECMDMAVFGATPLWIVLSEPAPLHGLTGTARTVRAVKISPDKPAAFKKLVEESR